MDKRADNVTEDNVTNFKYRAIDQAVVRPFNKEARVLLQALKSIWDLTL